MNPDTTYRIGKVGFGYRAESERTITACRSPRRAVVRWAAKLSTAEAPSQGDRIVVYREEDGALFLFEVRQSRVVELVLA